MPNLIICRAIIASAIASLFFVFFSQQLYAADLNIEVLDATGSPIENAVVYAEPDNKSSIPAANAIIEQRGKQFNP